METVIGGITIHYEITGCGKDALLLHGWGSSTAAWAGIIPHICEKYRCIAIDFPGCGESPLPQNPLTVKDYCDVVLQFMNTLGLHDPVMIGHSNGGRVILNMCADGMVHPEKIVLFDAAGIPLKKTAKQKIRQTAFKTVKRVLTLPLVKNYTAQLLEDARNHFGSADYNSAPPVMRATLVNLIHSDVTGRLHNIAASTLLIWGENDTATPLYTAKIMEQEIPDCGLCVIKNAGHWCFAEYPGQVFAILDNFL